MSQTGNHGATATTLTANGVALAAKGRFTGIVIAPTGAVTPTVTVYDNASAASGTKLLTVKTESAKPIGFYFGDEGINATNGVYVSADSFTTLTVTAYTKPA